MGLSQELQKYIEEKIFPEYQKNEKAHDINHIQYVIKRSLNFANTLPNINYDIVYTIAAFHDIGHHIDRKKHELISAEIMSRDQTLPQFFTKDELKTIKEAIEDHRASSDHEPRSIYGKIISTADRNTDVNNCLMRTYYYGKKIMPEADDRQLFERSYEHLQTKYGKNGYAKSFLPDDEYESFLKELRALLADKEKFFEKSKESIAANSN